MFAKKSLRQTIQQITCVIIAFVIITMLISACTPPAIPITVSSTSFQIPSASKTSTPPITTTPIPNATLTASSTPDTIALLASEFDVPGACLFSFLLSTDRNWIGADCKLFREIIITEKSSGNTFQISYQDLDKENHTNFSTIPLGWSDNGRYFYFTTRCCDFDDNSNSNGSLYRFDTEKQTWSTIVHARYKPFYFFSKDGRKFVYLNHHSLDDRGNPQKLDIGIVETDGNNSKVFTLEGYWGPIYNKRTYAWSKDTERFSIVLDRPTFHPHEVSYESVLFRVDFTKMSMEIIEEFNSNDFLEE